MKSSTWRPVKLLHQSIPRPELYEWLLHKGSFMQRLKHHGVKSARIDVVSHALQQPTLDERKILCIEPRLLALVREVVISSDEGVWMFARTVFPLPTLTGAERQLAHLKNRALGSKLFKDPTMQRSEFELASLTPEMAWYEKVKCFTATNASQLWARRSLFHIKNKPLLLSEVFLPAIQNL
ncbi:MAG: chorismate lyase [Gammaproteobacteria bacterium]|nr:chorismate lyase [Gammaproteobacteria bacterium]